MCVRRGRGRRCVFVAAWCGVVCTERAGQSRGPQQRPRMLCRLFVAGCVVVLLPGPLREGGACLNAPHASKDWRAAAAAEEEGLKGCVLQLVVHLAGATVSHACLGMTSGPRATPCCVRCRLPLLWRGLCSVASHVCRQTGVHTGRNHRAGAYCSLDVELLDGL